MNKLYTLILLLIFIKEGNCQNFLNGDFEINTASTSVYQLQNSQYSNMMFASWGFGMANELDIQTFGGYATPPSNNWFVSLTKKINTLTTDAFSLKIDTNLTMGNSYTISYLEYSTDVSGNNNIILEIGLSSDSLSFGQLIHSSLPPLNVWGTDIFTFTAPNNGLYLTVRTDSAGTLNGWNFVDNFHFLTLNGVIENETQSDVNIFPNPFRDKINFVTKRNELLEVFVYDITARNILQQTFTNSTILNVEALEKGIYIYEVRNKNEVIQNGTVVKE